MKQNLLNPIPLRKLLDETFEICNRPYMLKNVFIFKEAIYEEWERNYLSRCREFLKYLLKKNQWSFDYPCFTEFDDSVNEIMNYIQVMPVNVGEYFYVINKNSLCCLDCKYYDNENDMCTSYEYNQQYFQPMNPYESACDKQDYSVCALRADDAQEFISIVIKKAPLVFFDKEEAQLVCDVMNKFFQGYGRIYCQLPPAEASWLGITQA